MLYDCAITVLYGRKRHVEELSDHVPIMRTEMSINHLVCIKVRYSEVNRQSVRPNKAEPADSLTELLPFI